MKFSKTIVCWIFLLLVAVPCTVRAQTKNPQDVRESAGRFVQGFYNWYVPRALKDNAAERALKYKHSSFSPPLIRALRDDSEAQAKVSGEIVGLDFDPFLASQDPCERYEVGKITQKDDNDWVEMYSVCSGKRSKKPDVVAEVRHKNRHWLFVNFHYPKSEYPETDDLLSILKVDRADRQRPRK